MNKMKGLWHGAPDDNKSVPENMKKDLKWKRERCMRSTEAR